MIEAAEAFKFFNLVSLRIIFQAVWGFRGCAFRL